MKPLNRSHKRRNLLITGAVLVVLVASGATAWALLAHKPQASDTKQNTGIDYNKPTAEQQQAGDQIKSNSTKQGSSGSDQPPSPTPIANTDQAQVGVTITSAQPSNSQYLVRAVINTTSSTGTCTLTMEKTGASTVTMTAGTQPLASTSTCKGFNIPLSSLPSGTWNLTIQFSDGNLVGSATKQVSI